jgi:hypothetical protein
MQYLHQPLSQHSQSEPRWEHLWHFADFWDTPASSGGKNRSAR